MARYVQKIRLLGKERWIGWEIDGVGTEIPGLILADDFPEEVIRAHGIKEFAPLSFENFLGMNVNANATSAYLHDQDVEFRLDALQVGMERIRSRGQTEVSRAVLANMFGDEGHLDHPRVQQRLREWSDAGAVEIVGREDCYLRILCGAAGFRPPTAPAG
jgi:hypothetical protein